MRGLQYRSEEDQSVIEQKGFSLLVTHRDRKTGLVTHTDPYVLRIVASADGGRMKLWERPKGSGNIFNKKGEPVGRWEYDEESKKGKYVAGAAHKAYTPPETTDQKIVRELSEKDQKISALQKELAAIKSESAPKAATKAVEKKA